MLLNFYSNGNVANSVLEKKAGILMFSEGFTLKFSLELIIYTFPFQPGIIRNIPLEFTLIIANYYFFSHITSQFSSLRVSCFEYICTADH